MAQRFELHMSAAPSEGQFKTVAASESLHIAFSLGGKLQQRQSGCLFKIAHRTTIEQHANYRAEGRQMATRRGMEAGTRWALSLPGRREPAGRRPKNISDWNPFCSKIVSNIPDSYVPPGFAVA